MHFHVFLIVRKADKYLFVDALYKGCLIKLDYLKMVMVVCKQFYFQKGSVCLWYSVFTNKLIFLRNGRDPFYSI